MRVQNAKQPPMDAIVSATSLAAEALGLEKQIDDIANVRKVAFVMKAGKVYLNAKGPL